MIPAAFGYDRATSVDDALRLIERYPGAKLLAGGHSLIPLMKRRLAQPERLIDIGSLAELSYVRDTGSHIAIGALTRHAELAADDVIARTLPLVGDAARHVGDPQVRHWGTIGGSLCHADPAADLSAAALVHDAVLAVAAPDGQRTIPIDDWFRGSWMTALDPREILLEIRLPRPEVEAGWSFVKFTRRAIDRATVGVAILASRDRSRIALMNMGDRPLRATAVEAALAGGASCETAAQAAAEGTNPPSDVIASAGYRRRLAPVLTKRALLEATERRDRSASRLG